ncbi:hypothetical protein NQ317_006934 [Molorchus minor]|uniref:LITAF domain-containing protein n=1 Tax=Molorchus minor TaxID=1323400 RepID=A0ABQ9JM85_9CUCU|nr:hypothetical protein NQ317_006934 [Molorchus minor]
MGCILHGGSGPAGSQFGLLACLIVEVLNAWPMLKNPQPGPVQAPLHHPGPVLCRTAPVGRQLRSPFRFSFFRIPTVVCPSAVHFVWEIRQAQKIFLIWVCLAAAWILFICLVLLFYIIPVYDCKICSYFNCLPITRDFCASQNINFKREEPIV